MLHVVLFKPRPGLARADRDALVAAFERATREIPTVRGARVGRRVRHGAGYETTSPDLADYAAIIEFDDLAGLQTYLRHPAHQELGELFGTTCSSALVYDVEEGTLDEMN